MCVIAECSTPHRRRRAESEAVGDNLQKQKKGGKECLPKKGGGATFFFLTSLLLLLSSAFLCVRGGIRTHTNTHHALVFGGGGGEKNNVCFLEDLDAAFITQSVVWISFVCLQIRKTLALRLSEPYFALFFSERLRIEWVNSCDCHCQISPF